MAECTNWGGVPGATVVFQPCINWRCQCPRGLFEIVLSREIVVVARVVEYSCEIQAISSHMVYTNVTRNLHGRRGFVLMPGP